MEKIQKKKSKVKNFYITPSQFKLNNNEKDNEKVEE